LGDKIATGANACFNDTNLAVLFNVTHKVDFQAKMDEGSSAKNTQSGPCYRVTTFAVSSSTNEDEAIISMNNMTITYAMSKCATVTVAFEIGKITRSQV
jgi:hypothetical protein